MAGGLTSLTRVISIENIIDKMRTGSRSRATSDQDPNPLAFHCNDRTANGIARCDFLASPLSTNSRDFSVRRPRTCADLQNSQRISLGVLDQLIIPIADHNLRPVMSSGRDFNDLGQSAWSADDEVQSILSTRGLAEVQFQNILSTHRSKEDQLQNMLSTRGLAEVQRQDLLSTSKSADDQLQNILSTIRTADDQQKLEDVSRREDPIHHTTNIFSRVAKVSEAMAEVLTQTTHTFLSAATLDGADDRRSVTSQNGGEPMSEETDIVNVSLTDLEMLVKN